MTSIVAKFKHLQKLKPFHRLWILIKNGKLTEMEQTEFCHCIKYHCNFTVALDQLE